jgi:hypothetical protein
MLKFAAPGLSTLTVVLMAIAASAHAQNTPPPQSNVAGTTVTECTGNLAPGNYDAVDVPAGATCTINNGTVNVTTGGVTVGSGATFYVAGAPTSMLTLASGSLDSTNAYAIEVNSAHIHGNANLMGTSGGAAIFTNSFVGGTLSVQNSSSVSQIIVDSNTVGNSLIDQNNQATNSVVGNIIAVNLVCSGNQPPPNVQGNTVAGNSTDQCLR